MRRLQNENRSKVNPGVFSFLRKKTEREKGKKLTLLGAYKQPSAMSLPHECDYRIHQIQKL